MSRNSALRKDQRNALLKQGSDGSSASPTRKRLALDTCTEPRRHQEETDHTIRIRSLNQCLVFSACSYGLGMLREMSVGILPFNSEPFVSAPSIPSALASPARCRVPVF